MVAAFGSGDIEKATTNMDKFSQVVADVIEGLGIMAGAVINLSVKSEPLTSSDFMGAQTGRRTPFDPMSMKVPDLSPAFMQLVKAQQKADKERDKREKDRLAREKKMSEELKKQNLLKKANALLDKAGTVFNMDLIQNTAALMGKVTEDETVRLKLQQAILLGNATEAGNLAQELLASQIAAMKLSATNPLGGFTDALKTALDGVRDLRDELVKLGAPKVGVPSMLTPSQLLEQDYLAALADATNSDFASLDTQSYRDDIFSRNKTTGAINVVVSMDPMAAAAGVTTAVIDNAANGNSNNYSPIFSWAGGF